MPEFMPELGYIIQPDCFRWTMPRSICVHPDNRGVVALALGRNGFLTQGDLARHLEIALSTVNNFCRCVNVSVAKFEDICEVLGLDARTLIKPAGAASEAAPEDENKAVGAESATDQFFAYDRAWVGRAGLIQSLRYQNFWRCQPLTGLTEAEQQSLFEQMGFDMQPVYRCPVPEDWWLSHLEYLDLEANAATAAMDALRDRYLVDEVLEKDQYLLKQHNLIRSLALEHLETLDDNETT